MVMSQPEQIRNRVDLLENNYSGRKRAVKKWYDLIRLENDLHQEGMESVIGNDPRTSFNMAAWLLYPKTWSLSIDKNDASDSKARKLVEIEKSYTRQLKGVENSFQNSLHGSFFSQVIKNFITTGWLAFTAYPSEPRWQFNPISPVTVYPEYDNNGQLIEIARKYTLSADEARQRVAYEGWRQFSIDGRVTVRTLWKMYEGLPYYAIMIGNEVVKQMAPYEYEPGKLLTYIPIYCCPGGGLPDDGSITDTKWREEVGQAFVGAVASLQKNYDRMLTYMQQILRDTANAKWVQRVAGQGPLTPENVNDRGLVLSIQPGEDIYSPPLPALPPEMRTQQIDIRNQIQRGSFPDVSFGNFSAQVSVYLMSQATATAQQALDPFRSGLMRAISSVLTQFARMNGSLDDTEYVKFFYDIQIPGDFSNRANTARILNPNFKLSKDTVMRNLFPEVSSTIEEASKITIEDAMESDLAKTIQVINQFRQAAADADSINDVEFSTLLTKAANMLEQRTFMQATQPGEPPTDSGMSSMQQALNSATAKPNP